ncbi:MAG: acyl--CoA ligase [Desulfobacteraceae bacterium]|nr:acyl--CoA ligase [Desulfobacteraceae bacterium]
MKKCAFLTMGDIDGLKCDDPMVYGSLADKGWQVNTLSWHGTGTGRPMTPWLSGLPGITNSMERFAMAFDRYLS